MGKKTELMTGLNKDVECFRRAVDATTFQVIVAFANYEEASKIVCSEIQDDFIYLSVEESG